VVNWTVLILGFVICGQGAEGIVSLQLNAAGRCAAKPVTFEVGF
jgi:hypothetical protein